MPSQTAQGSLTSMYCLHLRMQIIDSLQKVLDGFLHERLIKATTPLENMVHVLQAHLGDLQGQHQMLPFWPLYSERIEELSDFASAGVPVVLHLVETGVQRGLTMADRIANINLERDILVLPANAASAGPPLQC